MVDRAQISAAQQIGQLAGVNLVAFVAFFQQSIFRGSHTTSLVTCGFSKSYNQAAQVPSSKVTCKSPRSPWIHCRMVLALVSMIDSITSLPSPFITAIEIASLCTSMPIYLIFIVGAPFGRVLVHTQNLPQRGALLYSTQSGRHAASCIMSQSGFP